MANPRQRHVSESEWQYNISEREEEIKALKHDISMANSELSNCRREMGRLKAKCLEFEDDIMGYRADISRWKTLYEQKSPQRPPVAADFDQQRQLEAMIRQLNIAQDEKKKLAEQLKQRNRPEQRPDEQIDNPVYRTQLQNVQVETNRLRYTINQKDDDIRRVLQDLKDQRTANEGLSRRLQSKEDEIDRLRKQLLDTPVAMAPTPLTPLPQNNEELQRLKEDIRRLSIDHQRQVKDLEERNIHLHQQNMMYEDDYKKEKQENQLRKQQLATAKEESRNLQAVIDVFNQGVGQGGINVKPPV